MEIERAFVAINQRSHFDTVDGTQGLEVFRSHAGDADNPHPDHVRSPHAPRPIILLHLEYLLHILGGLAPLKAEPRELGEPQFQEVEYLGTGSTWPAMRRSTPAATICRCGSPPITHPLRLQTSIAPSTVSKSSTAAAPRVVGLCTTRRCKEPTLPLSTASVMPSAASCSRITAIKCRHA